MRVPAGLPLHEEALHRLVARKEVLEGAREDVVRGGPPIGCGWAFVEDKARLSRPQLEGLLEGALLLPDSHDLLLQLGEADLLIDFLKHVGALRAAGSRRSE